MDRRRLLLSFGPLHSLLLVCTTIIIGAQLCLAHREHKVHNIVLYPDKHSWCETQQIKQVISYPGCKSEEIDNNVCVGACFSYSIPHTEPSDPGEVIVPYCDSCQPSDTTWHHVTLQCEKNDKTPPQLVKRVQIINNCSCSSCDADHHNSNRYMSDTSDDDDDFLMGQQNDVPDLLRLLNNRNESVTPVSASASATSPNTIHTDNVKTLMNHKIVTLLKNIQEKNSRYDKDQLIELLKAIQAPEHHRISDEKIVDFVESLNSENIHLDLVRLRDVLAKFEHAKNLEKHKKYLLATGAGHQQQQHHHHHHMAATAGTTTNNDIDNDDDARRQHRHNHHLQHQHHQTSSTGHHSETTASLHHDDDAVAHHDLDNPKNRNNDDANSLMQQQHTDDIVIDSIINGHHHKLTDSSVAGQHHVHAGHQHPQHPHHRIGEEIMGHGHLIKGPKGALVIKPDRIHEKLDVNPHELKPNHAGTLLSYSAGQMSSSSSSASVSTIGGVDDVADVAALVEKSSSRQDDNDE